MGRESRKQAGRVLRFVENCFLFTVIMPYSLVFIFLPAVVEVLISGER